MSITPGRRVPDLDDLERPGDYTGPRGIVDDAGKSLGRQVVFLLPTCARDWQTADRRGDHFHPKDGIHGVQEPPWSFRECPDGSLEIRASIACGRGSEWGEYWHGFLDEGNVWRRV